MRKASEKASLLEFFRGAAKFGQSHNLRKASEEANLVALLFLLRLQVEAIDGVKHDVTGKGELPRLCAALGINGKKRLGKPLEDVESS